MQENSWLESARPHLRRAALWTTIALVAMVAAATVDELAVDAFTRRMARTSFAVVLAISGILAVRAVARAARASTSDRYGDARGAVLGLTVTISGNVVVVFSVLSVLNVDLSALLLGGAITGVLLGIAAQQTLANFFAGLVLLAIRPLSVGEHVVLRSGPLGGEFAGRVTDMSLFYVDMITEYGPVKLPNTAVLASAIGPGARAITSEQIQTDEEPGPPDGRPKPS
jgi:small-conductance mechanosensitive channel